MSKNTKKQRNLQITETRRWARRGCLGDSKLTSLHFQTQLELKASRRLSRSTKSLTLTHLAFAPSLLWFPDCRYRSLLTPAAAPFSRGPS